VTDDIIQPTRCRSSSFRQSSSPSPRSKRHAKRDELLAAIAAEAADGSRVDLRLIEQQVRKKLDEWRAVLTRNVADARALLRDVLEGPITFAPMDDGFRFEGRADVGRLLAGTAINRESVPTAIRALCMSTTRSSATEGFVPIRIEQRVPDSA
jgi:hypothetical protein